jgi:outer membrane protein assembly factor BamB
LDAKTGETIFKERIPGAGAFWASPWAYEGKIFCPDSDGNTFVLEPGRELKILSTNKLPADQGNRFWASSAIANGTVFIRSTNSLYAIGSE